MLITTVLFAAAAASGAQERRHRCFVDADDLFCESFQITSFNIRIHEYVSSFSNTPGVTLLPNQQLYIAATSWPMRRSSCSPLLYISATASNEILNGRECGRGSMTSIL